MLDQDSTVIERQTYSCLEWLGDLGGLYDAMRLIGLSIVYPVAFFAMKAEIVMQAFGSRLLSLSKTVRPDDEKEPSFETVFGLKTGSHQGISRNTNETDSAPSPQKGKTEKQSELKVKRELSFFSHLKMYITDKRYRRLRKKATILVEKELDLMTYIKKSRMHALSTMSLLSTN